MFDKIRTVPGKHASIPRLDGYIFFFREELLFSINSQFELGR